MKAHRGVIDMFYEYCVMRNGDDQDPHRGPWVLSVCREWIQSWIDDGGRGSTFYIARRLMTPWEAVPTAEHRLKESSLVLCKNCDDRGYVSVSIVHPTNPNLDSWGHEMCDCRRLSY